MSDMFTKKDTWNLLLGKNRNKYNQPSNKFIDYFGVDYPLHIKDFSLHHMEIGLLIYNGIFWLHCYVVKPEKGIFYYFP